MRIRAGKAAGVSRFCGRKWDWSKLGGGAGGIGRTLRSKDWSKVLCEQVGLVRIFMQSGGTGQSFCGRRWDESMVVWK